MHVVKLDKFIGGWFVGNFKPSVFSTKEFEVGYKHHSKGEKWPTHYHKGVEINYLSRGRMRIQGQILEQGDIFVLDSYEVADPEFLEDCEVVVIKVPSDPNDKYEIVDANIC